MAEKNEYFTQKLENGTLQISEDVVASWQYHGRS